MDKEQIINEIKSFLEGSNNELDYLVNVETNPNTNKATCVIHEPNKDKVIRYVPYTPFLYIKDLKKNGHYLYNGDKIYTNAHMKKHGITIKKMKTGNHPRLEDGYPYKITSSKSYNDIINFFKDGGINPFETVKNESGRVVKDEKGRSIFIYRDLFYLPKVTEQFFISTGARLFKGVNEYKDIHKLTFDIETTGLRFEHERIFAIGVKDNKNNEIVLEVTKDDDDESEIKLIQDLFNLIYIIKPAIICGYNSEEFDFNFILGRGKILGIDFEKLHTTLTEKQTIRKVKGNVKIGNTSEIYSATQMWGYSVIDIMHAVKRTSAVNTEIKNNRLKYICQYEGISKPDRMYIEGSEIGKVWKQNKCYIINPDNNKYFLIPNKHQKTGHDLILIQNAKEDLGIEKYNILKKNLLDKDKEFVDWFRKNIIRLYGDSAEHKAIKFIKGKDILRRYLLDDLWETEQVDNLYNQSSFLLAKIVPTTYQRIATMGSAGIWNLLMTTWSYENDLAIPHPDGQENFSGGLARCYKKGFTKRVGKIDYASLYPFEQLEWDIFPMFDIDGVIKKMLTYLTTTRNIYKKLAIKEELSTEEVSLLRLTDHDTYDKYMAGTITPEERNLFKVKQLPIKILNNSLFGALGSAYAFNWSDNVCAARITCSGRLYLRNAIDWFKGYGLEPLLAVTDGINFGIPDTTTIRVTDDGVNEGVNEGVIEEMWKYGGKVGLGAIIEKFNKEVMNSEFMAVDNDGEFESCLNLSRINYALLQEVKDRKTGEMKMKVKLTGNTIKSKTMSEYIEEFVDNGIRMILDGKGGEFIDYYHDYAEKIYYRQIPLKKIASKSKFKIAIKDYLNRGTDKNGKLKARQAHMELIIADRIKIANEIFAEKFDDLVEDSETKSVDDFTLENIQKIVEEYMPPEPELGTMIYYVNNGTRKSHGDVKATWIEDENGNKSQKVEIKASLIKTEDLENNPDITGEYNVEKYLAAFNTRVKVLLDGFDPEIREDILVKIKRSKVKDASGKKVEQVELLKNLFTSDQVVLKNFDHDDYEESMYLEEKEIEFWNKTGYDPSLVWDGFKVHEEGLYPEIYQFAIDYVSDKMVEAGKPRVKSVNDELGLGDYVLIKNYTNYNLGYHNGDYIEILKRNMDIPKSPTELEFERKLIEEENQLKRLELGDDEVLNDEIKKRIEENEKKKEHFHDFKLKFGIDMEYTMEQVLVEGSPASDAFDEFVMDKEYEPENEYDDYDGG